MEISVIMSVYNGEEFLREAIESILSQTYRDFEFIIIDDGSSDNSLKIIKEYMVNDKRIVLIENEKNIGLPASLNKGIRAAKGKYIARMDADDISMPERFEEQYKFMEEHPEVGVCGSYANIIGSKKGMKKNPYTNDSIKASILFINPFVHPSVMLRTEIFHKNNILYDESIKSTQDYLLWVNLMGITHFHNISLPLINYRIHLKQISRTKNSIHNKNNNIKVFIEIINQAGFEVTEKELEYLFYLNNNKHIDNLGIVENFLLKLLSENLNRKYFPIDEFRKFMVKHWIKYNIIQKNICYLIKYFSKTFLCISPFRKK